MRINKKDNNIILENVCDFHISQTLECGQCFHFEKIDKDEYGLIHRDRFLHVRQDGDNITLYNTNEDDYNTIWREYFDLDTDYALIKEKLLEKDDILRDAINEKDGVRILRQDFFETLISFIISQNKQIPHIKQIVATLSQKYGTYAASIGDRDFYTFPTVEQLARVSEDELRECKVGFRAPYIYDAVHKCLDKTITRDMFDGMSTQDTIETLKQIKGVGEKIANCVALFGLAKTDAFPVDVWIKRIMEELYFREDTKKEVIMEFAEKRYGEYGGYAQQYLFFYGRDMKLGK